MRENSSVLFLILGVGVLAGLFFLSIRKPVVEKKTQEYVLSGAELKTIEKVDDALENASYAQALELLAPLKKTQALEVQLLQAEAEQFQGMDPRAVSGLDDFERRVKKNRGLDLIYHLGRVFMGAGKSDKAMEYFNDLLGVKLPDKLKIRVQKRVLEIALESGPTKTVVSVWKDLSEAKAVDATTSVKVLDFLSKKGEKKEYESFRMLVERQFPKSETLLTFMAGNALDQGNLKEATRLNEALVALKPQDMAIRFQLYKLYSQAGEKQKAFSSLDKAMSGDEPFALPASRSAFLMQQAMDAAEKGFYAEAYALFCNSVTADVKALNLGDEALRKKMFAYVAERGSDQEKAFHKIFLAYADGDFQKTGQEIPVLESVLKDPGLKRDLGQMKKSCRKILMSDEDFQKEEQAERQRLALVKLKNSLDQAKLNPKAVVAVPLPVAVKPPSKEELNAVEIQKVKERLQSKSNDPQALIDGGNQLVVLGDLEGAKEIYLIFLKRWNLDVRILLLPAFGLLFIWFPGLAKQFDQFHTMKTAPLDPDSPPCLFVAIGWGILLSPLFLKLVFLVAQ